MKAIFRSLCHLRVDLSGPSRSLSPRIHEIDGVFYGVAFSIAISFGATSLKARLKWNEAVSFVPSRFTKGLISFQGQIREGPPSVFAEAT